MWTSWLLGHSATSETEKHFENHYMSGVKKKWEVYHWWLLTEEVEMMVKWSSWVFHENTERQSKIMCMHKSCLQAARKLPPLWPSLVQWTKLCAHLVSRWVRRLVCLRAAVLKLHCAFFFSCVKPPVMTGPKPQMLLCSFPEQKSLSERPSLLQETGNTFSHLGADHKLRLLHHLFSGAESG